MRKLLLLITFTNIFIVKSNCQKDSAGLNARIEIVEKQLYLQSQQNFDLKKTTDSLQSQITELKSGKKAFDYSSAIPWVLTIIAILISIFVYKREVTFRNISFVTESNKMKITDPALWAFYDTYKKDYSSEVSINSPSIFEINGTEEFDVKVNGMLKIIGSARISVNGKPSTLYSNTAVHIQQNEKVKLEGTATIELKDNAAISLKGIESKKLDGKIRAYCYFKLNSFELVFNYNKLTLTSNTTWEDYMINSMIDSAPFYNIVQKESTGYLYAKKYQEKLKDFMVIAQLCKSEDSNEKKLIIIESKNRLISAYRAELITGSEDFSALKKYLNEPL